MPIRSRLPSALRGWLVGFRHRALGDMVFQVVATELWAINLRHPTAIKAEGEEAKPETGPRSEISQEFPTSEGALPGSIACR